METVPGMETGTCCGQCPEGGWVRCPAVPKALVLWKACDQHTDRLLKRDGIRIRK